MARTTSDLVIALLTPGGNYDLILAPDMTPFIDTAAAIVSRVLACAIRKGTPLTAEEAELLERWLAAHFYAVSDKTYVSRSTLSASGSFGGQKGMALDFTEFGQMAKLLDPSGCLALIGIMRPTADLIWLGKPESDQIDHTDRD